MPPALAAVLSGAGAALSDVVSATVFVTDIKNWPKVNAIWAEQFASHRPARAIAVSPQLHHGALLEIQVMALAPAAGKGAV